jgi:hypothetical protein
MANSSAAALAPGKQHYEISMFWKAHRDGLHILIERPAAHDPPVSSIRT